MNPTTTRQFTIALGLSLLFIAVLWLVLPNPLVEALDTHSIYYVAPSCAGVPVPCFTSIQAAVDVVDAPIDVIKVAAGTYTDLHARPRNDITTTGVVTQIVYISKTLTIQGGYTTINWNTPNPGINLTTLDAQGKGRGLYITGNVSPTIEGLRLTGGNSAGLGGRPGGSDSGGGVYVISSTVTLTQNKIFSNVAYSGGGLWFYQSQGLLANNVILSNTASFCGGLRLLNSPATVSVNTFMSNTATSGGGLCVASSDQATVMSNTLSNNKATQDGGGMLVSASNATFRNNTVISNTASSRGGGIMLDESPGALISNNVTGNRASSGGGIYLNEGNGYDSRRHKRGATLTSNIIYNNTANQDGGGLFLKGINWIDITLVNNVIAANMAPLGGGVYLDSPYGDTNFLHTTFANNSPSGLYATGQWWTCESVCYGIASPSYVTMKNTIFTSQTLGVYAYFEPRVGSLAQVSLEDTLWYTNTQDWGGDGTIITGTHNYWGDPAFVNAPGGNYHIGVTSAAIDHGVDAGVYTDLDGDPRPSGYSFDIGADEYRTATLVTRIVTEQLLLLSLGQVITYPLFVSNPGVGTTTQVVFTDTLPGEQQPLEIVTTQGTCLLNPQWGNNVTCNLGDLTPNTTVQLTLTVGITDTPPPYLPWTITNSVQATAVEANSNIATSTSTLIDCRARLNDEEKEYTRLQAAVDAAEVNDVIKVSGTSCSDPHTDGYPKQVVYLSKTLTIRGGYTRDFMEPPDPVAHPTTLDALGQGRVIYLAEDTHPTLEGLRITGGDSGDGGGLDRLPI